MEFTKLERAAIETILSEPMAGMDVLRMQFAASSVIKRDYTGVGFYTTIAVPRFVPPVKQTDGLWNQLFGGATGLIEDPRVVIGFHLWLDAGYLHTLEGVTLVGDAWPDESKIEVVGSYYGFPDGEDSGSNRRFLTTRQSRCKDRACVFFVQMSRALARFLQGATMGRKR